MVVFFSGLTLGGAMRYTQIEAQLSDVEITSNILPGGSAPLGNGAASTCG